MAQATKLPSTVAAAAPAMPHPKARMNSGSSTMLVRLPARLPTSPQRIAPSARSSVAAPTENSMAGAPSAKMRR